MLRIYGLHSLITCRWIILFYVWWRSYRLWKVSGKDIVEPTQPRSWSVNARWYSLLLTSLGVPSLLVVRGEKLNRDWKLWSYEAGDLTWWETGGVDDCSFCQDCYHLEESSVWCLLSVFTRISKTCQNGSYDTMLQQRRRKAPQIHYPPYFIPVSSLSISFHCTLHVTQFPNP